MKDIKKFIQKQETKRIEYVETLMYKRLRQLGKSKGYQLKESLWLMEDLVK
ncbi:hypothetical protein ACFL0W_05905 [Nanoarchaeota archaeon]